MIEHVSLRCSDVQKSRRFYEAALAPLGYRVATDFEDAVGFKAEGHTSFWVTPGERGTPGHIAFRAKDRQSVDAFYRAALEAGATDNGPPGLCEHHGPSYYAAFVLDRDGHNMEAVSFARPTPRRRPTKRSRTRPPRRP